jgi:hypothetical protein
MAAGRSPREDWAGYTDLFTEDCVLDVTEGTQIPVISGPQ